MHTVARQNKRRTPGRICMGRRCCRVRPDLAGSHTRRISHDQTLQAATSPAGSCCSYTESKSTKFLYECSPQTVETKDALNFHSGVASSRAYKAVFERERGESAHRGV
jgi:hypothetical protein